MYLDDNFKKYQKNPKKTWDLLKETTFGTKTSREIKEITSNGKTTNDPNEMANIFNKFFAEIGKKISDSVQHAEKKQRILYPIMTLINLSLSLTTLALYTSAIL